jgi:hypothetical protein
MRSPAEAGGADVIQDLGRETLGHLALPAGRTLSRRTHPKIHRLW